jgi:hypothetical protein
MSKSDAFPPDLGGYATVAERLRLFWERYPNGRIHTALKRRTAEEVVFVARVYKDLTDRNPAATGWAAEKEGDGDINLVACLENTETSAVGRALANLGFTASAQRPSAEEMLKASRMRVRLTPKGEREVARQAPVVQVHPVPTLTPALADFLRLLTRAERTGMVRPTRAARWRRQARGAEPEALERYEQRLRARLTRREG